FVLLPLPLSPVIYNVLKFLGIFKSILTVSFSLLMPKSSITSLLIVCIGLTVYFLLTSIYSGDSVFSFKVKHLLNRLSNLISNAFRHCGTRITFAIHDV